MQARKKERKIEKRRRTSGRHVLPYDSSHVFTQGERRFREYLIERIKIPV